MVTSKGVRKAKRQTILTFAILALAYSATTVVGVEPLHITFDPPLVPSGIKPIDYWVEQDMYFTGPEGFSQYDSGRSGLPDNGTAYLHFAKGPSQTLTFSFVDSTPFMLTSVDLAEYSTFFAEPKTITFVCHKIDGMVATERFVVDGLIDGPGGTLDFETFVFGPEFTELSYVEVPTTGYSMDNVVLSQLPGYETLIGLEITGPNDVVETTSVQYSAIAFFESGCTLNVTSSAVWSLDPNVYASVDENGLLEAKDINQPEDVTIYAQYSKGGVTIEAEMSVQISLHTPLVIHVPADYNTIQAAIDDAGQNDIIIVHPGTYYENINFGGKNITLRSTKPTDPNIVASTIIDGSLNGSVVTFSGEETPACLLSGFTITNCSTWARRGGGIFGNGAKAAIEHNIICENVLDPTFWPTSTFGGGLYDCDGLIQFNLIVGNKAYCDEGNSAGGGLCNCDGKICNNIIANNVAAGLVLFICEGGGLYNCNGMIQNNTIFGNSAHRKGGGIGNCNGTIENNIIWQNNANEAAQFYTSTAPSYSCIQDWLGGGEGNIDVDPCFVDAANGDYHLLPDSPCINTGDPNYIPEPNETDLDGLPRVIDGRIDMGAYEFIPPFEVKLQISPRTLNTKSQGNFIMAVLSLPPDVNSSEVSDEPLILSPGEIPSLKWRFSNSKITATFDRSEVIAALPDAKMATIEVSGRLTTGQYFYGTDTIKILK